MSNNTKDSNLDFRNSTPNKSNEYLKKNVEISKSIETSNFNDPSKETDEDLTLKEEKKPNILNFLSSTNYEPDIDFEKDIETLYACLTLPDFKTSANGIDKLISIILSRSPRQLRKIRKLYDEKYPKTTEKSVIKRDLLRLISDKCSKDCYNLILNFFDNPIEIDCKEIAKCLGNFSTNTNKLIQLITWNDPWTLKEIRHTFYSMYKYDLFDYVKKVSKKLTPFFELVFKCDREVNIKPNVKQCKYDVEKILDLGDKFWDPNNEFFQTIFFKRSFADLSEIVMQIEDRTRTGLNIHLTRIDKELANFILTINDYNSKTICYANQVRAAIQGAGTDEEALNYAILNLRRYGLTDDAMLYYSKNYKDEMIKDIIGDTSGDYCQLILTMIGKYERPKEEKKEEEKKEEEKKEEEKKEEPKEEEKKENPQ